MLDPIESLEGYFLAGKEFHSSLVPPTTAFWILFLSKVSRESWCCDGSELWCILGKHFIKGVNTQNLTSILRTLSENHIYFDFETKEHLYNRFLSLSFSLTSSHTPIMSPFVTSRHSLQHSHIAKSFELILLRLSKLLCDFKFNLKINIIT